MQGLTSMSFPMFSDSMVSPNFTMYMPTRNPPNTMSINLELILRIETTLKLNLIDKTGEEHPYLNEDSDKNKREVHFIRMEGIVKELSMELGAA